ncbi:chitinase [Streptomyces chartreusis]|uniref:chitinase n=1 Tax=Streptomyces chartreusis TaxID=1969 RepID=UPI003699916C
MRYKKPSPVITFSALCLLLLSGCGINSEDGDSNEKTAYQRLAANGIERPPAESALAPGDSRKASAGPGFPARYAAPYIETWDSPAAMKRAREASGVKYFNLAFIVDAGGCNPKFDGTIELDDPGWISAINSNRAAGGDVIASFGGANGTEIGVSCKSVTSLKAQYKKVVDTLKVTRIDLDIEGSTLANVAANDRRNEALAQLQREYAESGKRLEVNYTLPVMPSGLTGEGKKLLQNATSHGLRINLVNIMTMDYGSKMNMGEAAVSAANALHSQLRSIWPSRTDAQLWAMEGNTPMIGVNDTRSEVFSLANGQTLVDFAKSKGIQQISFWSLKRDRECGPDGNDVSQNCSGISQSDWQFSRLMKGVADDAAPLRVSADDSSTPPATLTPTPTADAGGHPAPTATVKPRPSNTSSDVSTFFTTGQVLCESGRPVVGVWVQTAHSSDSRFAAWKPVGNGSTADWWTYLPRNEPYSLHVGCGGTPDRWGTENWTGIFSGPQNSFNCDDIAGDPNYKTCVHR